MNDIIGHEIVNRLESLIAAQWIEINENKRIREKMEMVLDEMLANRTSVHENHTSSRDGYFSESDGSKYSDVAGQMTSE